MYSMEDGRSFKERYRSLNAAIAPDETLICTVIKNGRKQERGQDHKRSSAWKCAVVLASVSVCLYLAMPALAASSEPVYQMMYQVSPAMAQHFMPVMKEDVDNGIKMEVRSASIHGSTAEIYLAMQDLEGDRIDETTDLFDSYRINRPFDSTCSCVRAGYEADTGTVIFLITIRQWGDRDIRGDKITFSASSFISHQKSYENISIPVNTAGISENSQTQSVWCLGGSSVDEDWFARLDGQMTALVPFEPVQGFPVDGMELTGIGYVDGKLHIQTAVRDPLANDNHGYFWFVEPDGGKVESIYTFSFTGTTKQGVRVDYHEQVFEVPPQELKDYGLYGNFVTTGQKTDGRWSVTFPLEADPELS